MGLLLLSSPQPSAGKNHFLIIFLLWVVVGVREQTILAALEWMVGVRRGSVVENICLRQNFGVKDYFLLSFASDTPHYFMCNEGMGWEILTSSKDNSMERRAYSTQNFHFLCSSKSKFAYFLCLLSLPGASGP